MLCTVYYKHFFHFNKAEHIFYSFCTVINAVNNHCIIHIYYLEQTWKTHINHIVFRFHQLSFMLVIQLSYSDSGMPVKSYYYFSYKSVLDSVLHPQASSNETYSAWECSALCDVHIILDMNKTYPKRRDYLFSFNLNLDLFTLALENLYFNTLDREKVQGKSLGCIKSRGHTSPVYCTPTLQGATVEGWKSHMRLGSRGLPTPALSEHVMWIFSRGTIVI